ncbi:MAG: hypothetical protein Q4D45_06190 [Lachnospiraceae bacterium]|nr:hypothetical protein [Lachnospiraceae bacterium]
MKKSEKILIIVGTAVTILFILFGIPRIADYLKEITGLDLRTFMYLAIIFCMYAIGQARGGKKYKKLNQELRDLDRELITNHRIEYYIAQNKRLYKQTEDSKYRTIILNNIATAYRYDGKYEQSNNVLKKMNQSHMSETQKAALYNQQFLNYVDLGQLDKAKAIYEANKDLFRKYEKDKDYRKHYLVSRLFYELKIAGKDEEAIAKIRKEFDTLKISQKTYKKMYFYRFLEGKLLMAEGKTKEGRENLRLLQKESLMPGMKREIARAIKY